MTDNKSKYFEKIGNNFESLMSDYDVSRRKELIFSRLLKNHSLHGKRILELGCGTGRFSTQIKVNGGNLTVLDIGVSLTRAVSKACSCEGVAGDATQLPFKNESFDMIISSECIEHTSYPLLSIKEMCRVCRRGGCICFTTPNRLWYPLLILSMKTGVRKFSGIENWIFSHQARKVLVNSAMSGIHFDGCHMWPFQFKSSRTLLTRFDSLGAYLYPFMINFGVLACKEEKKS